MSLNSASDITSLIVAVSSPNSAGISRTPTRIVWLPLTAFCKIFGPSPGLMSQPCGNFILKLYFVFLYKFPLCSEKSELLSVVIRSIFSSGTPEEESVPITINKITTPTPAHTHFFFEPLFSIVFASTSVFWTIPCFGFVLFSINISAFPFCLAFLLIFSRIMPTRYTKLIIGSADANALGNPISSKITVTIIAGIKAIIPLINKFQPRKYLFQAGCCWFSFWLVSLIFLIY